MMIPHVIGIILQENKVLLINRKDKDVWEFPGGKVKDNEDMEGAVKRELLEELGIHVEIIQSFNEYQIREGEEDYHCTAFECNILKGNIKEADENIIRVGFVELDKIDNYNVSEKAKLVINDLK